MAEERVVISIELDDGSVRQGFLRVEKQAEETTGKVGSFFRKAGEVASGFIIAEVVIGSFRKFSSILQSAVTEAIASEDAVNKLNTSLKLAGTFSQSASASFQSMASQLQATTALSDEQVLSAAALARNFSTTNEQAQKLTLAAADLAAATGTDLDDAVRKLGGTLSGNIGLLGKQIPALKSLSVASLEAGAAIDIVAGRFDGAAVESANTFAGSIAKLKNAFSDILEEFGKFITRSPAVKVLFKSLADSLAVFRTATDELGNKDIFQPIISGAIEFSKVLSQFVITPLLIAQNIIQVFVNTIAQIFFGLVGDIAGFTGKIITLISPDSALGQQLVAFKDFASESFSDLAKSTDDSLKKIEAGFSGSSALDEYLNNVQAKVNETRGVLDSLVNSPDSPVNTLPQKFFTVGDAFLSFGAGFKAQAEDLSKNASKNFQQIGSAALGSFGQGVGNAFAQVGRAIAQGKNALTAFTNAIIAAFGQVAIQLGTQFILTGIAYLFAGYPNGPSLIAAGAALAAFGGVLSAVSGGSGGSASAPGPGQSNFDPSTANIDESTAVNDKAQQRVVVNIQGDVLDSRETSLRIVDLINSAVNDQGAVITARA